VSRGPGPAPARRLAAGPLTLRAFSGTEGPALHEAVSASLEHLRPWMPWARDATAEATAAFVRRSVEEWDQGHAYGYWMSEEPGGELVGCAGLHRRVGPGGLEIGYWVRADRVRRGYATASARALTSAALALEGVERVEIHCDEANTASAGVPRALGFRLDRVVEMPAEAPSEVGRRQVWVVDAGEWLRPSS